MHKTVLIVAPLILLGSVGWAAAQNTLAVNATSAGTAFSPGVHGQALPAITTNRQEYTVSHPKTLAVSRGGSIRGVASGLEAELFDWRNNNNSARPGTLEYLRYSRDYNAELFVTVNLRGLIEPDPVNSGKQRYVDTSINHLPTLSALAADWVRYTNRIVPTYRQGATISDATDNAILNSINWPRGTAPGNFDKLLAPGEAAVPKVKYWEIGNEPRINPGPFYNLSNGFTLGATAFHDRYAGVTAAMKAQDPSIKVGPTLLNASVDRFQLNAVLNDRSLPVDFISYHPYGSLTTSTTTANIESNLRGVYSFQLGQRNTVRTAITNSGRDPNAIELVASEVNVSNFSVNDTPGEGQMAHALGSVETVFSHARLGLKASHYFVYPAHRNDGTEYPVYQAFGALQDHMGDTLLPMRAVDSENTRVYTTRDSKTGDIAVWGLNFSNATDAGIALSIAGLQGNEQITLMSLGALSGTTTLFSSNLSPVQPGGPRNEVGWTTQDLTGTSLANFDFSLPAAELQVLLIHPVPEPAFGAALFLATALLRRTQRRPRT